ncbi:uncharacterized protein V6R79_006009 [Siganus canaliculatus]
MRHGTARHGTLAHLLAAPELSSLWKRRMNTTDTISYERHVSAGVSGEARSRAGIHSPGKQGSSVDSGFD